MVPIDLMRCMDVLRIERGFFGLLSRYDNFWVVISIAPSFCFFNADLLVASSSFKKHLTLCIFGRIHTSRFGGYVQRLSIINKH